MKQLEKAFRQLNIFKEDEAAMEKALDKLEGYMDGILSWNTKVNLTSITKKEEFVKKHLIDSVLCAGDEETERACRIVDVGTGGGFPGIPLAVIYPQKQFVLIDSLNKRVKIIEQLCKELDIRNVQAIHGRAEELAAVKSPYREGFDLCVSRAVANMATLCEYCLPFVKVGGFFIAYKGPEYEQELSAAGNAIKILGGEIKRTDQKQPEDFHLEHKLIYIKKEVKTPSKYPRKAGTPSKTPLK